MKLVVANLISYLFRKRTWAFWIMRWMCSLSTTKCEKLGILRKRQVCGSIGIVFYNNIMWELRNLFFVFWSNWIQWALMWNVPCECVDARICDKSLCSVFNTNVWRKISMKCVLCLEHWFRSENVNSVHDPRHVSILSRVWWI